MLQTRDAEIIYERVIDALHDAVIYRPGGARFNTRDRKCKPLGSKYAGALVGQSEGYVRKLLSPACEKHQVNLQHIVGWLLGGMDTAPLDELEAAIGRIAIKLPEPCGHGDLSNEAVHASKEFGDVFAVLQDVFSPDSDGGTRLTRREFERLKRETREAEAALEALLEAAEGMVQ